MHEKMKKEIPMYDPYTGQLNPYYQDLTGQPNPLKETNTKEMETTYYIKQEKLNNGLSRYYPIKKISFNNGSYWNEEYLLKKWYPAEQNEYCGSFNLAQTTIVKEKEYQMDLSGEVIETIDHEI